MKTQCTWFLGVWLAAVTGGQGGVAVPAASVGPGFAAEFQQAEGALRGGRVQEALRQFQRLQWGVGTAEEGVQAGIAAAACQQMLGMDCSATETLELAQLRLKDGQSATTVNLKLALANAAMRQRKFAAAAEHLKAGLELARTLKDTKAEARVLLTSGMLTGMRLIEQAPRDFSVRDSRGIVLESRDVVPASAYEQIRKPFDEGLALAGKAGDASLELQGRLNLAKVAILFGDDAGAGQQLKAVSDIRPRFAGTTLLGEQFTRENVQRILRDEAVSILHLASHGQFSSSAEDTFIVTHGGRISLDDLESFVRPLVLRETPLEMLVMSACETAKGNSRAAFGLAGVAIKSGARSVVATLWQVDDLAMTTLMSGFYGKLAGAGALSKAEALRQAQLALLKDPQHRHPYFWAPCILLGNWL